MLTIEEQFKKAIQAHQQGDLESAARGYESILEQQPNHPGANHLFGVILHCRGELESAISYIKKAISLCNTKAVYWNNYSVVLKDANRLDEAQKALEKAISIKPDYPDALSNLGDILTARGVYTKALSLLNRAIELHPQHAAAWLNIAHLNNLTGQIPKAINAYRRAVSLSPSNAKAWQGLGTSLLSNRKIVEAEEVFTKAVELTPNDPDIQLLLGETLGQLGRIDDARDRFRKASVARPKSLVGQYRHLSLFPTIFPDVNSLTEYREEYEQSLDAALLDHPTIDWRLALRDGFAPPFQLAHHGQGNRQIKEKFAELFGSSFTFECPEPRKTDRPRIGFLVTHNREAGFLRNTQMLINRIDSERFKPVVLCCESGLEYCRKGIRREDVQWVTFSRSFPHAVKQIRDAKCDILYHRQIGTDSFNYFLPYAKLAPIQCTGWGTHGTTGLPMVDYYLSSSLMEKESAQEYYTEKLHLFNTFPTCQNRVPKPAPATRSDFGLPESGAIYFCPQRLEKFHPEFDPLLRGVLESDPTGHIVILEGDRPYQAELLQSRLQKTLGQSLAKRILFSPKMPARKYFQLLSITTAILDAPHYSASLTGFDAFSLGIPIITMPGKYNVERYALGLYRRMGISDLIADTPQSYIDRALRVGTDHDFRMSMHEKIMQRNEILFEDDTSIHDHEDFFDSCWRNLSTSVGL